MPEALPDQLLIVAAVRHSPLSVPALLAGESAETIAQRSYVSLATIRSQIRSILLKLGVKSQLAAVALAPAGELVHPS